MFRSFAIIYNLKPNIQFLKLSSISIVACFIDIFLCSSFNITLVGTIHKWRQLRGGQPKLTRDDFKERNTGIFFWKKLYKGGGWGQYFLDLKKNDFCLFFILQKHSSNVQINLKRKKRAITQQWNFFLNNLKKGFIGN